MQERTKPERPTVLAEETQGLAVTRSRVVVDGLRRQSTTRDQTVHTRLHPTPSYEQWRTVQGIGTLLAHPRTLATGALSRFPPVGHSAASCRCVDSTQISTGKRQGTGTVNHGHPSWAWASREAAQCARRVQPAAPRCSQRKLAQSRNHTVLARKAVAPKLARAC